MSDSSSYQDAVNWRPERPCREEVRAVIAYIRDQLTAQSIPFAAEQDDLENPNCWAISSRDHAGYEHLGLVSWSESEGKVVYAGLKPEVARRDTLEGVPEDESLCWWQPRDAQMFVQALDGTVREIMAEYRTQQWKVLDGEGADGRERNVA